MRWTFARTLNTWRLAALIAPALCGSLYGSSCSVDFPFDEITVDIDDDDDDFEDFWDDVFDDDD